MVKVTSFPTPDSPWRIPHPPPWFRRIHIEAGLPGLAVGLLSIFLLGTSVYADSESLAAAQKTVEAIAAEGRSPSFQEFIDIVNTEGVNLSEVEFLQLRHLVQTLQKPEFAPKDLADLIATKREMIADFVVESQEDVRQEGVDERHRRYELLGEGGKYLSREWFTRTNGVESIRTFISYDGKVVRKFRPEVDQGDVSFLESSQLIPLVNPRPNPVWNSMLLDSEAQLGQEILDLDLVALLRSFYVIVYAEPQSVEGRSCVVASHETTVAYLDPDLDFSVIRRECWRYSPPPGAGYHRSDWTTIYSEFMDAGSGLFLPTVLTFENTASGHRDVLKVTKMMINGGIDEAIFETGVIPDGTLTFDKTHEHGPVSYIQGDTRSMEAALRGVTPVRKRSAPLRMWVLMAVNVVIICGLGCYLFARRRRSP